MKHLTEFKKVQSLSEKISDKPGLNINKKPIYTNGISTCIGIGVHLPGNNYFEHMYPHMYMDIKSNSITKWKEHIPFLMMFEEFNKFDNLVFIELDINVWNTNNKFGIDKDGPWYYENTQMSEN